MVEIVCITLENEMDQILAHKKAMRVAEKLQLTISTQSTFATATVEICRESIEQTDLGELSIGLRKDETKYFLVGRIRLPEDIKINPTDAGFLYAKKLVSNLELLEEGKNNVIEISIGLPRSVKLDSIKLNALAHFFKHEEAYTPYEEIKIKNRELLAVAEERYSELLESKFINDRKNEFISIASHELKTPVTIIKAYSQMALSASGTDKCSDKVTGYLNRIESQSKRLQFLIQQLLDVSQIESGEVNYRMEEVDLNAYLEDALSLIRHTIPAHKLNLKLQDSVKVELDRFRMEQVLSNILGNAAKYSPDNEIIELSTGISGKQIQISVKDNGIGMSDESLTKIFNKFHRNDEVSLRFSGIGMGLYITSKIIEVHGGEIWAESKEGAGSTFHFSLPVKN